MKNDWISITDQLPEFGQPVLVCKCGEDETIQICRLESITQRKGKEGIQKSYEWLEGRSGYDTWYYDVTHWQPLIAKK